MWTFYTLVKNLCKLIIATFKAFLYLLKIKVIKQLFLRYFSIAFCEIRFCEIKDLQKIDQSMKKPSPDKKHSLGHVLNQAEEIKENIEEAAINIASVNETLKQKEQVKQEEIISPPIQAVEDAIAQNKIAESQVAKAAIDLEQVNTKLAKEVTERIGLESELADTKNDLMEVRQELLKARIKEEESHKIAFQDTLTGLPNRVLFEQRLDHSLIQSKRYGLKLAVMFIDIDEFKSINDSYGHDLGDQVLMMLATRLQAFVRGEDMVSRWGGDEFICLLLNIQTETDVVCLAEKMVNQIAEACEFDEIRLSIRASIGIAIYPQDGESADTLFKKADQAMYRAKRTEKGVML